MRVPALHRHLHDDAGLRVDRQDRRVGRAAFRAERRQDHLGDFFITFQHADQRRVEPAGGVVVGGGGELVLEAEGIQEGAQPGVVVCAEGIVGAERVGDAGQRLAEVLLQHVPVRHVVRHLAQPVHVVAESEQTGRQAGEPGERVAHPGGAGDLAERADMRQAGRAVASLEQGAVLAGGFQAARDLGGFLEGPGLGNREGVVTKCCGHAGEARGAGGGGSMTGGGTAERGWMAVGHAHSSGVAGAAGNRVFKHRGRREPQGSQGRILCDPCGSLRPLCLKFTRRRHWPSA